jgi:cytoskeleton protein RodZ
MIDAGIRLRQLREEKGMSIEAMAAALKVSVAKLNALEDGRLDAFPNAAFVRALAMSICKLLKVDHAEVLAKLPLPDTSNLHVDRQNQQPFKENGSRLSLHNTMLDFFARWLRRKYLLPAFILLAAFLVYWWPSLPSSTFGTSGQASRPDQAVNAAQDNVAAEESAVPVVADPLNPVLQDAAVSAASAPELSAASESALNTPATEATPVSGLAASAPAPVATADNAGAAPVSQGEVTLMAKDESWVRIKDADGTLLIRRLVLPGEQLTITGKLPLRVTVGNAMAIQLQYQGKNLDLSDHARGNVARLDLE